MPSTATLKRVPGLARQFRQMCPERTATACSRCSQGRRRQAFDTLTERHKQKIFLLAKRYHRSREDAEEVVQDSFIQAFVHLDSFHGNSRFSTWLTRIASTRR